MLVWKSHTLDVVLAPGMPPELRDNADCSVATGSKYQHKHEEEVLLKEALGLPHDEVNKSKGVQ